MIAILGLILVGAWLGAIGGLVQAGLARLVSLAPGPRLPIARAVRR